MTLGLVIFVELRFVTDRRTDGQTHDDSIYRAISGAVKSEKSLFEQPFGGLRDNVRTPSIARWKARDRLPIRHD